MYKSTMATSLADLTASITSALANLPPQNEIQEPERFQVLGALAQLQEALQPPILGLHKLLFGVRQAHFPPRCLALTSE
jgi:hypothetical protein